VEIDRFSQEPSYTSAILSKLHGIEIASKSGEYIKLEATDIADRGQGSAEYRYGADLAITATVSDGTKKVRKAILFQVKAAPIGSLPNSTLKGLKQQIRKMKRVVNAPKVAGIRKIDGWGMFEISSGNRIVEDQNFTKFDFPEYFNQRVITTLDGETDERIVNAVQESSLRKLDVLLNKGGTFKKLSE